MSSWKGKSRGGALGHLFFVIILKYLNLSVAYFFLRFVAFYFVLFSPKAFKAIFFLNRQVLGYGRIRSILNVYRNFYTFGQILLDKAVVLSGVSDQFQYESIGMEHIDRIQQENKGGVLITSHFGGWQSAAFFLKDLGVKPKLLMMEAEHRRIQQIFDKAMGSDKLDVIPMSNDLSHVFEIAKAFRQKELISIQGDRVLEGSKTIRVHLLGKEADFPAGPFTIIAKFNVPVSFIFSVKTGKTNYACSASPVIKLADHPDLKGQKEKERFLVEQYAKHLEEQLLKHPEQWFNYYDFWRLEDAA